VREADNLTTLMCRMSWKPGSLNLLEPSGPHRACYGTPLPLPLTIIIIIIIIINSISLHALYVACLDTTETLFGTYYDHILENSLFQTVNKSTNIYTHIYSVYCTGYFVFEI
jgi:hypothetical protein